MCKRFLFLYGVAGLIVVLGGSWFAGSHVEHRLRGELTRKCVRLAEELAAAVSEETGWPELMDRLGRHWDVRMTVVRSTGEVVVDSSGVPQRDPAEDYRNRPEVSEALRNGRAQLIRYSTSLEEDCFYAARLSADRRWVVRISVPIANWVAPAAEMRRQVGGVLALLWLVGGGPLFLMVLHWRRLANRLALGIRTLGQEGDLSVLAFRGPAELADLGALFRTVAGAWDERMRALEAERNRSRAILDGMSEGVLVVDNEGRVLASNAALDRLFGLVETPVGRAPLEILRHPDFAAGFREILEGVPREEREIHVGGRVFLVRFGPVVSGDQRVGAVAVLNEITELRRLQVVHKEFVSNVSHELRTPLTSIQGYAETLLQETGLEPIQRSFLEKIDRNARMLSAVVEDLLQLARLERSSTTVSREWISFRGLVADLEREFGEAIRKKGLEFRVERSGEDGFRAAPGLIHRVFHNLLENAVKYTDSGAITIRMQEGPGEWHFSLADTGVGIPEEHLEKIFDRFYRVETDRSRRRGGTGVGLAIVRHIVHLHGGRVWAESRLHHGTTIHFTLPKPGEPSTREK